MEIISKIKEVVKSIFKKVKKDFMLNEPIYMENGACLICHDKEGVLNKKVTICAEHIDPDADMVLNFPQFAIHKSTSRDGQIGMTFKHVLTLDTDEEPTEYSNKLLTSGTIYELIKGIQEDILDIRNKIEK